MGHYRVQDALKTLCDPAATYAMIDLPISDSVGNVLFLTTSTNRHSFDTITCSPSPDGFTTLNSLLEKSVPKIQIEAACNETIARNEVCILPREASSRWRVLLTPRLRSLNTNSRQDASRLMEDLFNASQAKEVQAHRLLVTHFAYSKKYPEPHVLGIFDALMHLKEKSFLNLKVLGFEVADQHLAQFEHQLRGSFVV